MDGSGFDAWTRRRFGMAAGGLAASVAAMTGLAGAKAAKKKKKKDTNCCQKGKHCDLVPLEFAPQCCTGLRCDPKTCFCKSPGQFCTANVQCCSNHCVKNPSGTPPTVCATKA